MLSRSNEQLYRFISEGTITMMTSPFFVNNVMRQAPNLLYPILPLYYLADAVGHTMLKPEIKGDNNVDATFTFTNRLSRNAKHYLWNVVSSFGCSFLAATAGMPAATVAFSLIVIAKCAVESRYQSNEMNADIVTGTMTNKTVFTTPYMR